MYKYVNLTKGEVHECDAVETISLKNNEYCPTDTEFADGFFAKIIKRDSSEQQHYENIPFVFPDHILKGTEDIGEYFYISELEEIE